MLYKQVIRRILFLFQPETAHAISIRCLNVLSLIPGMKTLWTSMFGAGKGHEKEVMGLRFPNPVGLAAGFDKDAKNLETMHCFGFGFIEIGTLTPKPQPGNEKPRSFRLTDDRALINRMGFNNEGVLSAVERLKNRPDGLIIGGNIGKNKITPNEEAVNDYLFCYDALYPYVDYFVVNVSSPNTPGLRALQEKEPLMALLKALQDRGATKPLKKPILLKIAPDLTDSQLDEIVEIVKETQLNGIVATNTTIGRNGLKSPEQLVAQAGGLSGAPVRKRSTEVVRYLRAAAGKELVIIGVGGIFTAADAKEKLAAGADLVQVYTGFIYEGPSMVKNICKGLS